VILELAERPGAGEGLLVLHHGRGTSEQDLIGLADALDPQRRLHVAAPRGPLVISGAPGFHWYAVPRVGYPDPATFATAVAALADTHDALWERTGLGPERTVFGGFSMGAVMSYAMAFDPGRPDVAGALIFSGFIPTVPGWAPRLTPGTRVLISHGRHDPVIGVGFAHAARDQLEAAGVPLEYRETDAVHTIEASLIAPASAWLAETLALR
jgi:phospholipase/carboxylesterase